MIIYNLLAFRKINSGAGRFASSTLKYLSRLDDDVIVFTHLALCDFSIAFDDFNDFKRLKIVRLEFCKSPILRIAFETVFLPFYVKFMYSKGIFLSPIPFFSFYKCSDFKYISTVHDLTPFKVDKKYGFVKRAYVKWITNSAVYFSDKIITVSEYSRSELITFFRDKTLNIQVLYNVIPYSKEEVIPIKNKVFFFVGNVHEGKNLVKLIEGFELFCERYDDSYELHLIGKTEYNSEAVIRKVKNSKCISSIRLEGFVSQKTLIEYYRHSCGMVFPSINEGFGLPIIEALKYKCPMSLANSSVFPEIAGDCAFYFDPTSEKEIADMMNQLVNDHEMVNYKISQYETQLKKFAVCIKNFREIIYSND